MSDSKSEKGVARGYAVSVQSAVAGQTVLHLHEKKKKENRQNDSVSE